MKNYLILSGGAYRGAFQLGAVEVLLENGIKFDKVFGISTGALNGCLIAQNKMSELHKFWSDVEANGQSEIYNPIYGYFENNKIKLSFGKILNTVLDLSWKNIFKREVKETITNNLKQIKGLYNMNPLFKKLYDTTVLEDFVSDYYFGVVDYNTGNYHSLSNKDFPNENQLVNGVIASASMPLFSLPIEKLRTNDKTYFNLLDGGLRKSSPINDAIKLVDNKEEVMFYIVNCNTGYINPIETEYNILDVLSRTIEIMMSQMFLQDLDLFKLKNEMSGYKKIDYVLINTDRNLLGDPLKTEGISLRYELGRQFAKKGINKRNEDNRKRN